MNNLIKNKKILNTKNLIITLILLFSLFNLIQAEENWTSKKIKIENEKFSTELKKWPNIHKNWNQKRIEKMKEYYPDLFPKNESKYCESGFCWKEDEYNLYITDNINNKKSVITKYMGGAEETKFFNLKYNWIFKNKGEKASWKTLNTEFWESINYGEDLKYISDQKKIWTSYAYGKLLEFNDNINESWKSYNYGERIEWNNDNFELKDEKVKVETKTKENEKNTIPLKQKQ